MVSHGICSDNSLEGAAWDDYLAYAGYVREGLYMSYSLHSKYPPSP